MMVIGSRYALIGEIDIKEDRSEAESQLYSAQDLKANNKLVAIKIFEIHDSKDQDITRELFKREYTSLGRLNHPNIVKYLNSGQDGNKLFLVMEYFNFSTLKRYVNENELALEEKLKIAGNIAEGLAYAHEKDVIHRDLKPCNILINNPDDIRIIDFGISKILNYNYNCEHTVRSYMTVRYAAPEQLLRTQVKVQSDMYSYGLNLAYILSQEEPPEDRTKIVDYISRINCSSKIKELLYELTEKDASKRPKSMQVVKRVLDKEYKLQMSQTKKLYIRFNTYIQNKLVELGMLDYRNIQNTKKFLREDLSESHIYRRGKGREYVLIGKTTKYICRQLRGKNVLDISNVNCIDDQIDWEREVYKGVEAMLPWTPIMNASETSNDSCLDLLIQDIIDQEKIRKTSREREKIKNSLLIKWHRFLDEEFSELNKKARICHYNKFELDETGFRILVETSELEYEIKNGEPIQMMYLNGKSLTVGEFDGIVDNKLRIRLKRDINPADIAEKGYLGLDIKLVKNNLKKLARALNAIRFSNTANHNLADIITEPSIITMNNKALIDSGGYFQDILNKSPKSDNANAVKVALGTKDLFLIQGPPGTGKSTVITEITCQILKENPDAKILLTSQSHVAVDHVINKIAKLLPEKRIIRIGRSEKISDQSQNLIMSEQLSKWVDKVKENSFIKLKDYLKEKHDYELNIEELKPEMIVKNKTSNFSDGEDIKDDALINEKLQHERLISLMREWHRRLGKLDEFDEIFANKASIIAATCLGIASRNALNDIDFDWVIVDEAARATPLELLVPLVKGKKIILVGDHRQLPPVINVNVDKLKLEERGIKESDLEISLFEDLYDKMLDEPKLVLETQFRMHPDISKLVADIFYPSVNIKSTIKADERKHDLNWWPKSIKWIDTSGMKKCNETEDHLLSKKNACEAKVILKELEKIESTYRSIGKKDITVSVISGYNAQKNLLFNLIKPNDSVRWKNIQIIIDNVDAFQGSETDIVIYSLVRCNEENRIGFLYDERRLNVALSRGRNCLIIVGNIKFAEKARSFRGNPFIDIIKFIGNNTRSCLVEGYNED